jgi:uncharacterized ferredoxin-like protein
MKILLGFFQGVAYIKIRSSMDDLGGGSVFGSTLLLNFLAGIAKTRAKRTGVSTARVLCWVGEDGWKASLARAINAATIKQDIDFMLNRAKTFRRVEAGWHIALLAEGRTLR